MIDGQYVVRKEASIEDTVSIRKLIGKKVLSRGGKIIGKVAEIRMNSDSLELEGIVVERMFGNSIYIGKSYFARLSSSAIILNIELNILVKGKKVITLDGKVLGKVKKVNRKGKTNDIDNVIVSSLWKTYTIPASDIKKINSTVLIRRKYNATKNYIRKRSK